MRVSLGPWLAASIAVACSSTAHYFDEPPPAHGGHSGGAGTSSVGGHSPGGSAGASSSGKTGVGGSSAHGGSSGSGDSGGGGSGGSSGNNDGAKGGDTTLGGTGGSGGMGGSGGVGGTDGGSTSVGGGGQSGTSGTGGTNESGAAGDVGTAGAGGEPCVGKPEVCDGVSNDCDEEIDEDDVCPIDCSAKTRDGHVYLLCITTNEQRQRAYQGASSYCDMAGEELGLDMTLALARIDSQEESDFAKAWVRQKANSTAGMVWIGANDLDDENQWVWGRGTNAVKFFTAFNQGGGMPYQGAFNDWAEDRPNAANGEDEDCGAMDSEFDWAWNDIVCQNPRIGWLCEQTP